MKKNLILILLLFCTTWASAQVNLSEDYMVERIMMRFKEINQSKPTASGWRIQVLASTDRRKVEAAYSVFKSRYPYIPCEWKHISPYYKLQAGAYLTRLEAIAALEKIKVHYRTAFPTIDQHISINELLRN